MLQINHPVQLDVIKFDQRVFNVFIHGYNIRYFIILPLLLRGYIFYFTHMVLILQLIVYFIDRNVVYIFSSVQSKLKFKTTTQIGYNFSVTIRGLKSVFT